MKDIILKVTDYDINDDRNIEISFDVFSPDDFNAYDESDGIRYKEETITYPKGSSFQFQLAKWAFQKVQDISQCYNESYKRKWVGIKPQYIFNTLMNQIRGLCVENMGNLAFKYEGKNSLANLWNEVQPKVNPNKIETREVIKPVKGSNVVWVCK